MSDTIAAIATGQGRSAIGILRISGPEARQVLARVFTPAGKTPLWERPAGSLIYGSLRQGDGTLLDRCMATFSLAPHSYTGEDTAELQCHGSPAVLTAGLEALFAAGARQARAGEFTRRAFLNGKLDLTQAEAVIDLIDAETTAAAVNAAGQLSGAIRQKVQGIYDELVNLMAHYHVVLDYPDEDLDPFTIHEISDTVSAAVRDLRTLSASYRRGRRLTEGVPTALVGLPNAGKSSLLNALLGYDRAIVTPVPGTTRDTVEETCVVGGTLLRLVDTAGLRETHDQVEQLGVARSRAALERAELVLAVVDGSVPLTAETTALLDGLPGDRPVVVVLNKCDLPCAVSCTSFPQKFAQVCAVSARTGAGLEALEGCIAALLAEGEPPPAGELITNARQAEAIGRAADSLAAVGQALAEGMPPDCVLTDVEGALYALGEVTGGTVTEDVTDRIFSRFCVGK
ncbi:MAG: tRNA uridine-5-carboxymethylaminomethyl(34) synthesis GTPase MnmE [Clostridiales bacterium]|nr:tRNA uridine-5-carboxymethylaminomethyl(34) synthesis GTPase MnmE [Clostridiales bacterium]